MQNYMAMCIYRVKDQKEDEFLGLLRRHAPTLRGFSLLSDEPSQMFRGTDESGKSFFVEFLPWKDPDGHKVAEQLPDVLAIWEKMGQLVESRLGRPSMEFPMVEPINSR
jgi:hypothetical protein